MSEFELQQLFIATRWEFDVPTILLMLVSLCIVSLGARARDAFGTRGILLLQLAYVFAAGFLFTRMQAAIVRAGRLTELLAATKPSFILATPSFQQPTYLFRYGTFVVFFLVTLVLLQRAKSTHRH
ncbi:MAG: hypothetical protein RLZZ393_204 [Pseudomonadota bacterium]|jgi:hypothetical protein